MFTRKGRVQRGADYDVILVGAGHNGLVAAAYIARAGYRVGVFERRALVGGAVSTQEIVPGYQFDLGGSAHILIRLTPVVEELALERYGLEYLELDPLFFAPFPDGEALFMHRDEARTIAHLEDHLPGEGERYARFLREWKPFAETVAEVFMSTPSPLELGRKFAFGKGPRLASREALRPILRPYGDVVDEYFRSEKLKTMLVWMAAQSGPPPTEPLTGPFLLWHPLYHKGGAARPRGGSGMLTQALARCIADHGGAVHTGAPVEEILVEGGQATGIRVGAGVYTARAVISGAHVAHTLGRLLPEAHRPPEAKHLRIGDGFGAVIRAALREPIAYTAHPGREARIGLQLVCRDRRQIHAAYGDYLAGRPAADPPIVGMTFSAVDDTLAPPGGEVLWLWAQYFPYTLAEGDWDRRSEAVAESIFAAFERYAPGTRAKVVDYLFQHPLWLERELGLLRGNVMHLEMGMDQMFFLRPFLGMSNYRTHLRGLYLTGAGTHPGGGIMGASGRNAARVLLRDLERRRI